MPAPSHLVLGRPVLAVLPAALLGIAALRQGELPVVAAFAYAVIGFCATARPACWRKPLGPLVYSLYLVGILALGANSVWMDQDWELECVQAVLIVVVAGLAAAGLLRVSGVPQLRQAARLAARIASDPALPGDLGACRGLADVKALREAVQVDAAPALALLGNPRPAVRLAALAALEFRKTWEPGQAELILEAARLAADAPVRAAAIYALANVSDPFHVQRLADFLHDPVPEVRRATAQALLWDSRHRWPWIRTAVHNALADPRLADEGALLDHGAVLSTEAAHELATWASQKGTLAVRAVRMLCSHYRRLLEERTDDEVVNDLRRQLTDAHVPADLRTELALLLLRYQFLDRALLDDLINPRNPVPLRLVAADALLAAGPHEGAVAALREVARLPNREIALATADVVQRRLGTDLGLPVGEPLPAVHTRQAAEVTRRVMKWATGKDIISQAAGAHA